LNAPLSLTQQGESGVTFSVAVPGIAINDVILNAKTYKRIDLPTADKMTVAEMAEDGKPDIPIWSMCLAIPDQAGISLDVTYSGYDVIENIDMAPVQPSESESNPTRDMPFTLDETIYSTDAFYPGKLADAGEPFIMREIRGAQVTLYPVQYNPVRHEARVYRDLSVSISYSGDVENPNTIHRPYLTESFVPLYKAMFSNFDEIYSANAVKKGGYVIIVKPSLADTLRAVALWKHKLGYPVRIVRTTEIATSGTPTALQVYNFLANAYANWDTPPEFVMLIGDRDNTTNTGIVDYPYNGYPSDHKYACVSGTDYIPDIFVARLSIDSPAQLRIALAKILKYEEKPFMGDPQHWIRGLSVAYTYYESSRLTVLWVRQLQLRHGFAVVDSVCTTGTDNRLSGFMRNGPAYIQYRGAGSTEGWAGPAWTISDLNNQPNNQKLGVMSPLTCGTGDFGGECFGETWIRMGLSPDSLKGGPAYYGVSDHNTHTRWNNPIMIGYFFGIFEENIPNFAAAAVRGKLQEYLTFPSYRDRGQYVEQYFHTYNMLGDPGLELRTAIPKYIVVSHPDTIALGLNHVEVNVVDSSGAAISDAVVTLIKGADSTEEVFSVAKTDGSGNTSLSFDAVTTGSMYLTVSGKNLIPYEGFVEITNSDLAVGFDSLRIDDDAYGESRGNGDGLAGSGEIIELGVSLKNFGISQPAINLSTLLEPLDEGVVSIFDATRSYGDLNPGESRMSEHPYLIYVNPNAKEGDLIRLKQTVTDGGGHSWYSSIEIPVAAPKLSVGYTLIADSDNRLNPGDSVDIYIQLQNTGSIIVDGVNAMLTTTDDYTSIISANAYYSYLGIGDTLLNADTPLRVTIAPETFEGRVIHFTYKLTTSAGSKLSIPISISVGVIGINDPVGPDSYGYYIFDNSDSSYATAPTYNWVELVPSLGGHGTRLNFNNRNDDNSVKVTLPFDMIYYGQPYGALIVCTNGFVSPDTFRMDSGGNFWANFFNWPIPDPGNARGQISPLWDDLAFTGTTNGVYTWYDSVNYQYYIEWYHFTNRNTAAIETFQLVITNPNYHPTLTGDSEFFIYYNDVSNNDVEENYATVGFESWDERDGIQYTHDNVNSPGAPPLVDSRTLRFTTNTGRGGIQGQVNLHNGGSNGNVRVSTSTGQYRLTADAGTYWLRDVPPGVVNLTASCLGYFPGTVENVMVDMDKITTGIDVALDSCPLPSALTASDSLSRMIQLIWSPVTHPNLIGYDVYRSRWENGEYFKLTLNPVSGTSYTDNAVPDSNRYWYYVSAVFTNGNWAAESFGSVKDYGQARDMTGIAETPPAPAVFFLAQNYPNPFNPTTSISFGLPQDSDVRVEVFNLLGQRVRSLINGNEKAGYKTVIWDGKDESGKGVASGVYFYRVNAGNFSESKKMTMLK
jgi:hypothetical protein